MKRYTALFLTCLLILLLTLTGCNKTNDKPSNVILTPTKSVNDEKNPTPTATITEDPNDKVINVYSFTDELPKIVTRYKELHPDCNYRINYIYPGESAYQPFLDLNLAAGGKDVPDIYGAESAFVLNYTKGGAYRYAAPYKELGIDVDNLLKEADCRL